jgi:hypothetical protein
MLFYYEIQFFLRSRLLFLSTRLRYTVVMRERKLLRIAVIADGFLLLAFCLCLILGIYVATEPAVSPLVDQTATAEPTETATASPSPAPTRTRPPTETPTLTPVPTLQPVTPLPTRGIEEPAKPPYIFPTPIQLPK